MFLALAWQKMYSPSMSSCLVVKRRPPTCDTLPYFTPVDERTPHADSFGPATGCIYGHKGCVDVDPKAASVDENRFAVTSIGWAKMDKNHHALDAGGGCDVKIGSDLGLERLQAQSK